MRAYILQVISVSFLVTVCEFILPCGKVRRFAAPVLSLAIAATVVLPAVSLIQGATYDESLFQETETLFAEDAFSEAVSENYAARIESEIEALGEADATVYLGENFTIRNIVLSGKVSTSMMTYITTKLEVPRSYVEIREA